METARKVIKKSLDSATKYIENVSGIQLRDYQRGVVEAIFWSVTRKKGLTIVVEMARQGGKNEVQAQIEALLLMLHSYKGGEIVIVSPTFKPQTENAMRRLRGVLEKSRLTSRKWKKESGYVFRIGQCLASFFSGQRGANVVGATASLLLLVDEAQDILESKFYKDFHPMAASTNATVALFGTAWTRNTLLAKEKRMAQILEAQDGIQRVFSADADVIAAEVPHYGEHVQGVIARLGRQHPIVKTQYFLEEIDAEGGMFAARRAMVRGRHAECEAPRESAIYAVTIDVAGQDESAEGDLLREIQPRKDSTALTIAEVDLSTLSDPMLMAPSYRVVKRHYWTGTKHVKLYGEIAAVCELWMPAFIVVDATGIGEPLYSFLAEKIRMATVKGMKFTAKTKSDMGYRLLAAIDSGRFKDLVGEHDVDGLAAQMQGEMEHCEYEIKVGSVKTMAWGVPDGVRNLEGDLIHDDLLIGAAMLTELDGESWPAMTASSAVIQGVDPIVEIDTGGF
jgi:hypothetical protein